MSLEQYWMHPSIPCLSLVYGRSTCKFEVDLREVEEVIGSHPTSLRTKMDSASSNYYTTMTRRLCCSSGLVVRGPQVERGSGCSVRGCSWEVWAGRSCGR